MSKEAITEAIKILLGEAPEDAVEYAVKRIGEGSTLCGAVSEFLQSIKLQAECVPA